MSSVSRRIDVRPREWNCQHTRAASNGNESQEPTSIRLTPTVTNLTNQFQRGAPPRILPERAPCCPKVKTGSNQPDLAAHAQDLSLTTMPAASTVDPPLLSIAVLTWNRTTILEKCLRSLLAQNCRGQVFEIIVCDDGSTDGTGQMVRELSSRATNLRYVRQPHKGIAPARNLGLSAARGNLIAFASDEYVFGPGYVQTVLACFREHPEIQAVRFKVVAANRRFGSRVNHWHYSLHFVKRLVPEFSDEPARFHRAVKRLKAMARYKEKLSTEHNLEAAGAAVFRREVFEIVGPPVRRNPTTRRRHRIGGKTANETHKAVL